MAKAATDIEWYVDGGRTNVVVVRREVENAGRRNVATSTLRVEAAAELRRAQLTAAKGRSTFRIQIAGLSEVEKPVMEAINVLKEILRDCDKNADA
jgi:hypothetical protein